MLSSLPKVESDSWNTPCPLDPNWLGDAVRTRCFHGLLVVAVLPRWRNYHSHGSTQLAGKDVLYLIGKTPDLKAFAGDGEP